MGEMTDLGGGGGRRRQVRVRGQRAPGWGGGGGDGGGARWAVGFGEDYRVFKFPFKSLKFLRIRKRLSMGRPSESPGFFPGMWAGPVLHIYMFLICARQRLYKSHIHPSRLQETNSFLSLCMFSVVGDVPINN